MTACGTNVPKRSGRFWGWSEICTMWDHPDWTARELADELGRTEQSVRHMRMRYGRYNSSRTPICSKCGERPVWVESVHARRLGLCKGCYLDEEEMRIRDAKRNDALRQMRMHARRRGEEQ